MKVYLVCWTTEAMGGPGYYVEKVFSKREDAEIYIHDFSPTGIYGEPWVKEYEVEGEIS